MKDISSDKLMDAMLAHQLDGNEMKMIIAYVRVGGWKAGTEVFLPEAKRKEWGISDATAKRVRKVLKEKGWLQATGNKSRYGCDKYTVHIPALPRVDQNDPGRSVKLIPQVGQIDPSGSSNPPLEVTKEVMKEVTKTSNKEAPSARSATASPSLSFSKDKDDLDESSLIGLDLAVPAESPIEPEDTGVAQNDPPHSATQNDDDYYDWNGMKVLKVGRKGRETRLAPVEEVVKAPCPRCSALMDKHNLCWNMACVA